MTNYTSLDAYRSHDLNIAIKTSSGDEINLDFSNEQSLSYKNTKTDSGSSTEFSFASMQSYKFEVKGDGIDAQDAKEIDAFMKIAQPFIDDFMAELGGESQTTPLNKIADELNSIFAPIKEKNENAQSHAKNEIVSLFDNAVAQSNAIDKIFDDAQKLLDKVLDNFDKEFEKFLYA